METDKTHSNGSDGPNSFSRRRFLEKLSIGLSGIAAAIIGIPILGFLVSPLLQRVPEVWRSVGSVDDFKVGTTTAVTFLDASPVPWAGVTAKTAAWLRRENEGEFIAFSINCTHLGCPVRWLPDANLFMCPCHGGVYYKDGSVAAGPPPKPLPRYPVRVRDGRVEILAQPTPLA
ncbi:MAG: ubiquinol-cytochrome c reductase iron-sulfur subunit [Ignavibacteriales bacterium]